MNTLTDKRRTLLLKALSVIAVAFMCINIFSRTVLADTGPKRSINIKLKNLPSELTNK